MSIKCPTCGQANPDGVLSCRVCGAAMIVPLGPPLASGATPFVGRQRELSILQNRLDDARSGHGNLVMLVGEAGVGKTWLAREFATQCQQGSLTVLWGSCFEGDWQPPYGPWVEALGGYVRSADPDRLHQELSQVASPLAQLVPAVRAILPDLPPPVPLGVSDDRLRLYDAVGQFLLDLACDRPVVIVVDDLHWADPDSLRLLHYVSRLLRQSRLLLVNTYRDPEFGIAASHPLVETLAALRREGDCEHVVLRGLSQDEVGQFLSYGAEHPFPEVLALAIHAETGGNPFYLREVFRGLVEEGKIERHEGHWSSDVAVKDLGIPVGVRQVVSSRMTRLPDETRRLLRLASAFTAGFAFDLLQALCGLSEDTVLDCLDQALEAGLLRTLDTSPPSYDFAHAIVRHTLYEEMNPDRRARLHRRIAHVYEQVYFGRESAHAAEVASQYHASRALPGMEQGIVHALAAAGQARESYAYEAVVAYLRIARDLAGQSDPKVRSDILCKLAIAEAEALLVEDCQRSAKAAMQTLEQIGTEQEVRAEFVSAFARVLKQAAGNWMVSEPWIERGLALLGERHNLTWARLMLLRDQIETVSSGLINADIWLGLDPEAVAIVRTEGDEEDYASTLGFYTGWQPREETQALLELATTWRRPLSLRQALGRIGRGLQHDRDSLEALFPEYVRLVDTCERYGSLDAQVAVLAVRAGLYLRRGDLCMARQASRKPLELLSRLTLGIRYTAGNFPLEFDLAYFLDGNWESLANRCAQYAGDRSTTYVRNGLCLGARAAYGFARAGKAAEARRYLEALTPILERMGPRMMHHNMTVGYAAGAVWLLEAKEYAEIYRRLALGLIAAGVSYSTTPHECVIAWMSALLGDAAEAEKHFRLARAEVSRSGGRPQVAILDFEEAFALIRAGSRDRERISILLGSALAAFRELDMLGWAQRAVALQERLPVLSTSTRAALPDGLTQREAEVLRLLAGGSTVKEVGSTLVISPSTVERHIANIYAKIGARNRAEATAYALAHGLLDAPKYPPGDR